MEHQPDEKAGLALPKMTLEKLFITGRQLETCKIQSQHTEEKANRRESKSI